MNGMFHPTGPAYFCLILFKIQLCVHVHHGLHRRSGLGYLSLPVDFDDTDCYSC